MKFFGATAGNSMLWDESANQLKIVGTGSSVALDVDTGDFTVGAYGLTNAGAATIASMAGDWTNAGRTVADLGSITTADINGGTVDATTVGVTTAAAGNFSTIGATSTGTIAGTTIDASTDFTVGASVMTTNQLQMTPSTNDTVTLLAATGGAFSLTTIDTALTDNNTNANIQINCGGQFRQYWMANEQLIFGTSTYYDGNVGEITGQNLLTIIGDQTTGDGNASGGRMEPITNNVFDLGTDSKEYKNVWVDGLVTSGGGVNLGFGTASKLNTITTGVEVTGTLDATSTVFGGGFKSSLEQAAAGTGVDLHSSATIRAKEDNGVYQRDASLAMDTKFTTTNIENTNFNGSMMVTDADGVIFTNDGDTLVPLIFINLDETDNNIYHSAEYHCAMQEKVTTGHVPKKWLSQKIKASYDGSTVQFQTSDSRWMNLDDVGGPPPGEFCAQKWDEGSAIYMVLSYCPYKITASSRTVTYAVNGNGLSMPILEEQ